MEHNDKRMSLDKSSSSNILAVLLFRVLRDVYNILKLYSLTALLTDHFRMLSDVMVHLKLHSSIVFLYVLK